MYKKKYRMVKKFCLRAKEFRWTIEYRFYFFGWIPDIIDFWKSVGNVSRSGKEAWDELDRVIEEHRLEDQYEKEKRILYI